MGKKSAFKQETWVQSLGQDDPLKREWQLRILTWESPWTGVPGGLQSIGRQRVRHD